MTVDSGTSWLPEPLNLRLKVGAGVPPSGPTTVPPAAILRWASKWWASLVEESSRRSIKVVENFDARTITGCSHHRDGKVCNAQTAVVQECIKLIQSVDGPQQHNLSARKFLYKFFIFFTDMGRHSHAGHANTPVQYLLRHSSGTTGLGASYQTEWAPIDRRKR